MLLCIFQKPGEASQLSKVARLDSRDLVQLYFTFDKTPKYKITNHDRRIDLIFSSTSISPDMSFFPADEDIVKILPRPGNTELIVSLFFRYKPQNSKISENKDGKVVFETRLGNEYSKTYQELAERLKGLGELSRIPEDYSNPVVQCPYRKDWMSFFSSYESSVDIEVPVKFTITPFPIIRFIPPGLEGNLSVLSPESLEFADRGAWAQLADMLLEQLSASQDLESQKMLALTLGEVLLRREDFDGAYRQLYLLNEKYNDQLLGTYAAFLLIHLKAKYQDANIAEYEFQELEPSLSRNSLLSPYLYLAQIEAALASRKYVKLNKLLLRDDIALPEDLQEIVQIHRADYWYAIKQPIKAFAAYQLHTDSTAIRNMPYSLNGYCASLYQQRQYQEAATCYEQLSQVVATDKASSGLISYRKLMARLKTKEDKTLQGDFAQIENAYPDTEAGFRSALKKNDLLYLQNKSLAKQLIEKYAEIAQGSKDRPVREEAIFKQAVLYSQIGDTEKCVELLQDFLREFLTSDVRMTAQALLIDTLPAEIKRLVDAKAYLKALVLAKKNKNLFENNWINGKFLADIAMAYDRTGLYDEAQKLYLYLIEIMPGEQREEFYLPMIQATFDHGNYGLVEDYASQYIYNYPDGKNVMAILLLRLHALMADDRLQEALHLLPSPLPDNLELWTLASNLYFRTENYQNSLLLLNKISVSLSPLPPREKFMLAECLFQTGSFEEAEKNFLSIEDDHPFYEQSLFRLAILERKKGNEQRALSLFQKIVEKGKNPLWKKYAEQELQFAKVSIPR